MVSSRVFPVCPVTQFSALHASLFEVRISSFQCLANWAKGFIETCGAAFAPFARAVPSFNVPPGVTSHTV